MFPLTKRVFFGIEMHISAYLLNNVEIGSNAFLDSAYRLNISEEIMSMETLFPGRLTL